MPGSSSKIKTLGFISLGCPKNLVDSERMLGLLAADGLVVTSNLADADAIVINTCGFLEASKIESIGEIQQAVEMKSKGRCQRVVVVGCLVQRHKSKLLAMVPGIDRLLGVFDREHIVQAVRGENKKQDWQGQHLGRYHNLSPKHGPVFEDDRARMRLTPRHYAYLRISEGCNQGCSFCTIPAIRGPMRSKPVENILAEARELAADGAVELNLIGQDTTSYGSDIGYRPGLAGLLQTLDRQLPDVHWLRLMYAYPSCFTNAMIHAIANAAKVVKYIDIPLQHINDRLLKLMKRRVTRKQIITLLEELRGRIPGITIRTTFIAGCPTETDAEHNELVDFVRDFGFDMMGVFAFSAEPGTAMGKMAGQIPEAVKQQRLEELMLVQQQVAFAKAKRRIGQTLEVLVDGPAGPHKNDGWLGRWAGQAPDIDSITLVQGGGFHAGQLVNLTITGSKGYDLIAQPPRKKSKALPILPSQVSSGS